MFSQKDAEPFIVIILAGGYGHNLDGYWWYSGAMNQYHEAN